MHLHVWRPIWWIKNSVLCINAFLWYVFFFSKTGHYSQKVPSLESQTSIVCNIIQFLYTVAQLNVHLGQIKVKSLLTFLKKTIKGFQLSSTHFHPPPVVIYFELRQKFIRTAILHWHADAQYTCTSMYNLLSCGLRGHVPVAGGPCRW